MSGNGWPVKTLSELCTLRPPKAEARKRLAVDAAVSFLPMEDLGIDKKHPKPNQTKKLGEVQGSYTYFADGDVLLAKVTPCFQNGKLGIAKGLSNGVGFGSSEFFVLRPHAELDSEYLYYFLSRADFREEGVNRMGGAVGLQRVPPEFLLGERLPLPPLAEQRRIVGILDEAFTGIATAKANAEQNFRNARNLFESHLDDYFSGTWEENALEDVVEPTCTLSYGIVQPGEEYADGLPIVRPTDLTQKLIPVDGLKRVDPRVAKGYRRTMLVGDELLICVRGSTGVIGVASPELKGANVTRGIVPIRFNGSKVLPEFGYYLFRSTNVQHQVRAGTYGAALMQINIRDLRKLRLVCPPVAEQAVAVERLKTLDAETQRLASLYQQKLTALDALKKSLLHQAFSAKLMRSSSQGN